MASTEEPALIQNPFINRLELNASQKLQCFLMLIFVAPVRLIIFIVLLIISYVIASIVMIGLEDIPKTPLTGFRKKLKDIVVQLTAMYIAVLGIHHSVITGQRAERFEAPILVLAPHTSFFDAYAGMILGAPTFLADEAILFQMPFIGKLFKMCAPIVVRRDDRDSREYAIEEIKKRATAMKEEREVARGKVWSQLLIFPEGTCGNLTQLLIFKPGAFFPGLPVQPVCLKWSMPYDHITWCFEGPNERQLLLLTVCQLDTTITLDLLPVHIPDEKEKMEPNGAYDYAANVRYGIAKHLNLPTCEYTYQDAKYLTSTYKPKRDKFWTLYRDLVYDIGPPPPNTVDALTLAWNNIKQSTYTQSKYMINVDQFSEFLKCNKSFPQRLFNAFDWVVKFYVILLLLVISQACGKIDLREYLITLHINPDSTDYIRLIFLMFADEHHMVNEIDFIKMFRFSYEQSVAECRSLYRLVIADNWDPNFARVRLILSKHRDFAHIFIAPQSQMF